MSFVDLGVELRMARFRDPLVELSFPKSNSLPRSPRIGSARCTLGLAPLIPNIWRYQVFKKTIASQLEQGRQVLILCRTNSIRRKLRVIEGCDKSPVLIDEWISLR